MDGTREGGRPARRSRELFVPEFRRDTLALCASFFFCLLSVYIGTNWVPSLLTGAGFGVGSRELRADGVQPRRRRRRDPRRDRHRPPRLAAHDAGDDGRRHRGRRAAGERADRGAVGVRRARDAGVDRAVSSTRCRPRCTRWRRTSIPTGIRATGVGTAVAVGRIGGVLSPVRRDVGARVRRALAVVRADRGTMTLVFAALASVRNHIPRRPCPPAGAIAAEPAGR